jgi:glycosyltransferase involved in cell wall biosynthesis
MRILHVTPYYVPAYAFGGVTRSVEGMARASVRRGHQVTVLTTDALDQNHRFDGASDEVIDGVRVIRVPNLSPWMRGHLNLSTPFQMRAAAQRLCPDADIIHSHEFRTIENILTTPIATRLKKPLVLSPHGTLNRSTGRSGLKTAWDRLLSPAQARRFVHIFGLSQVEVDEVRALWADFGVQGHFSLIPNGVDPEAYADLVGRESFRARYNLGQSPVCLFMARLHPRKGVGLLLEAFKAADVPDARLVIAGPDEGMLEALKAQSDDRIIFTGFLSGAERLAALAAADMLALPAVGEGLPMIVLEAMAARLPVIVSPGCNLPEVQTYGAGIEVEPSLEPLRDALRLILTDANRRIAMGNAGRALVEERFTWDSIAAQLETKYLHLISKL